MIEWYPSSQSVAGIPEQSVGAIVIDGARNAEKINDQKSMNVVNARSVGQMIRQKRDEKEAKNEALGRGDIVHVR